MMKLFKSIGWTSLLFTLLIPEIARSQCKSDKDCSVSCSPSSKETGMCTLTKQGKCSCSCGSLQQQKKMITDIIQDNEGVDKSQIDNLDEIVRKAIEESSQKVGTPINFTVKVRPQVGKTESTSQYTIKTSEQ